MMIPHALTASVSTRSLFIARDAKYFRVSGGPGVPLPAGSPLRTILRSLADMHRESPLGSLSVDAIFDAGWRGESVDRHALAGRVYCAISKLRRMGLREVLTRTETGYRLDPRCLVIEETHTSPRHPAAAGAPYPSARATGASA